MVLPLLPGAAVRRRRAADIAVEEVRGRYGRWRRALVKKYVQAGIRSVNDEADDEVEGVSPAIHQTCLHWAWELKQDVLDEAWEG